MQVVDAAAIRRFSIRGAVVPQIKVFSLDELQINSSAFIETISHAFELLPFDAYDPARSIEEIIREHHPTLYTYNLSQWLDLWNGLFACSAPEHDIKAFWKRVSGRPEVCDAIDAVKPFRKRASWQFKLQESGASTWIIEELGRPVFTQKTQDERARERRFAPLPRNLITNQQLLSLLASVCQMIKQTGQPIIRSLSVTVHMMRTYASTEGRRPAPEGVHQDGADFIVSGIVIDRVNVRGGVSKVYYDRGQKLALEHQLEVGEGLFQADTSKGLWHEITSIYPIESNKPAFRSIVGLDIDLR